MPAYADYPYYADSYLGNVIPKQDFPRMAKRASAAIDNMTRNRAAVYVTEADPIPVQDATCAVAEVLYRFELNKSVQGQGEDGASGERRIASEGNDGYSVSYEKPLDPDSEAGRKAQAEQAYTAAAGYLVWTGLLYAGVGMR